MKGPKRKGRGIARQAGEGLEWVGARVPSPFYVAEDEPFRPDMIVWMELPEGLVPFVTTIDPNGPAVSVPETLVEASPIPCAL